MRCLPSMVAVALRQVLVGLLKSRSSADQSHSYGAISCVQFLRTRMSKPSILNVLRTASSQLEHSFQHILSTASPEQRFRHLLNKGFVISRAQVLSSPEHSISRAQHLPSTASPKHRFCHLMRKGIAISRAQVLSSPEQRFHHLLSKGFVISQAQVSSSPEQSFQLELLL